MSPIPRILIDTPRLFLYAAAPIALDYGIFKIASTRMWKYGASTMAGLGAIFVLSQYTFYPGAIALAYLAYKVVLFWSNIGRGSSNPSPSKWTIEDSRLAALRHPNEVAVHLGLDFNELSQHLEVDYPEPWTTYKDLHTFANDPATLQKVREQWESQWSKAYEVIGEAADQFEKLRQELWGKFDSNYKEDQHRLIAEFLQRDNSLKTHSTSYSGIDNGYPNNLLGFYRFIRSMSYSVKYRKTDLEEYEIYQLPMYQKEEAPFSTEGRFQFKIRQIYNQAIEKWLPVMEYLPNNSPYRAWIQKDEMNGQFNLNPPPLPSY